MLHEFVTANRAEIILRAQSKATSRREPQPTDEELENGVPVFLDQLVATLRSSSASSCIDAINVTATRHGSDLLKMGFTIAQVVHDYGDVCQSVTELADETREPITNDEFHILNRCLDDAIAQAVTEYARLRESTQSDHAKERLGTLAHELRNKVGAAMLAFEVLKSGRVGVVGSTGAVLDRNLRGIRDLVDITLADVRIEAGKHHRERISVHEVVEELELEASLEANARGVAFTVEPVPHDFIVDADRSTLSAALMNLLHNAFKFSHRHGHVSLKTSATTGHVLFDVQDECGGLPPGNAEELFRPFTQRSVNRTGLGLGLSVSRRGIEANGGDVRVRDLPGQGCIFTIELPRYAGE